MKVCGIVVEYNPFHNGHQYHIEQARKLSGCDVLIAIMSAHFVQRGEPSIIDKWQRAEAAILNGVDLVLELPFAYSTQSAQQFAHYATNYLKLAQIDTIVFGSESNNLEELKEIASMSINVNHLKESLKTGIGFAKAYGLFSKDFQPNDILAIAYLKAIQDTTIKAISIQRTNHYHDLDTAQTLSSASAIRNAIRKQQSIDHTTCMSESLSKYPVYLSDYYPYLRMLLLTLPLSYLQDIFLISEGIENHLINQAQHYESWEDFIQHATNKRYTRARIQRICIHILTQTSKAEMASLPSIDTLRPLAFNEVGQAYLKHLKKTEVKVASRFAQLPKKLRDMEYRATILYTMNMDHSHALALLKQEIQGPRIITKKF